MQETFYSAQGRQMNPAQVVKEVLEFIREEPDWKYKVMVGSDSVGLNDNSADFVTAIVVHRVGNGGRYFWRRFDTETHYTLRDRIIREVMLSLDVAQEILAGLQKEESAVSFDFEIHADIGENGDTKVVIQEVIGMIRAYDFQPKIKPESYAATKVADRHV